MWIRKLIAIKTNLNVEYIYVYANVCITASCDYYEDWEIIN